MQKQLNQRIGVDTDLLTEAQRAEVLEWSLDRLQPVQCALQPKVTAELQPQFRQWRVRLPAFIGAYGKWLDTFLAVELSAVERLVPILMTALVTGLGLLPLAIGTGEAGREIEGQMAILILGGLFTSTLLNLLVLPILAMRWKMWCYNCSRRCNM